MLPVPTSPLDQCVAIYGWLELALGVLLPLTILATLEQRSRQLHAAWQEAGASGSQPSELPRVPQKPWPGWRLAAVLTGSGDGGDGAHWQHRRAEGEEQQAETVRRPLAWVIHFYLLSCLTWLTANALTLWV